MFSLLITDNIIKQMLQFTHQIISKIIAIVAAIIIALGIVQMPAPQYEPGLEIRLDEIKLEKPESQPPQARKAEKETKPKIDEIKKPLPAKETEQTQEEPPPAAISLTELNKKVRQSIVNILCNTKTSTSLKSMTGSGVIIDSKGIILTTSHLGQYFLLEETSEAGSLDCLIRKGDIAEPAYDAELLYIPSIWVEENVSSIIKEEAKGTGENDYAFLLINKSLNQNEKLPADFVSSEPNFSFDNLPLNLTTLLAAYPAGFLGGLEIQKNLGLTSTFSQIKALYTFSETEPKTFDLFSLKGNIVSQGGSSGGAVIDTRDGKLLGIIVTNTEATTTASRELNIITLPHISRSFQKLTNQNIIPFLANPESFPTIFSETEFLRLKNLLIEQLRK